jgi:transcriptional antiterminator NusG
MFTLDEEKSVEMPEEEVPAAEDPVVEEEVVAEAADDGTMDETSLEVAPSPDDEVMEEEPMEAASSEASPVEDEVIEEEAEAENTAEPSEEESPPPEVEEAIIAEAADETQVEETAPEDEADIEEDATAAVSEETIPPEIEEEDDGRAWYVVHCYSGYENKVRHNLEQRIETMGMKNQIFDVVVPTEEEIEVKDGKRKTVERRVFPGYILVNMLMSEESWYVVRNTPGVTSFVGMGNEPVPLRPEEVSQIIKRMEADAPRIKVSFRQGERVRIIAGPFNDFRGTVDDIDMERAKVRVMVNFFGRETPVELDFLQVEKA